MTDLAKKEGATKLLESRDRKLACFCKLSFVLSVNNTHSQWEISVCVQRRHQKLLVLLVWSTEFESNVWFGLQSSVGSFVCAGATYLLVN